MVPRLILILVSLGGCAGVYAEVAASHLPSASFSPSGGGADTAVDGASTVGFNLGVDFGNTRHRFSLGYAQDTLSYPGGSSTIGASAMRYDFNLLNLAERLKLRLGLGVDFGSESEGGRAGAVAGIDASYFLTWSNTLHVFAGARVLGQSVDGGNVIGKGLTARVAISHTFGETRPDQSFVVLLAKSNVITSAIELGATALGCITADRTQRSEYASLLVTCPGERTIWYFQIAEGMMITCRLEQSEARCRALSKSILDAAVTQVRPAPRPTPPAPAQPAPPAPPTEVSVPVPPTPAEPTPPNPADPAVSP